jgi:glyceraldehyde 3-phosphate dehydrogenase
MAIRVGINGFGRIGRLVYRIGTEQGIEFVAVNDLVPADNLAYLLKYDTMHGRFKLNGKNAEISAVASETGGSFTVNGHVTKTSAIKDPAQLPWKSENVHYVLESTGLFTDFESASKHIAAGAKRVIISAPTKSEPALVPTLVLGVNHETFDPSKHTVISNASCTTNCLAPIAKVIHDNFGLEEGLMTTIHAATATQPTQDGPSKKDWRGGRNAYQNIIPASTGAAKAVTLALPALKGKLTGMSFRVPTADVSAVDLTFKTGKDTSLAEINAAMKAAANGAMKGVLAYTDEEVVSSDFISDRHSSIFDAKAGIELNKRFFKVVSWYDNEAGYAARCVDMIKMMAAKDGIK